MQSAAAVPKDQAAPAAPDLLSPLDVERVYTIPENT